MRIGNVPIYALDGLVRRSPALQRTPAMGAFGVSLHPEQASALGLTSEDRVEVRQGAVGVRAPVVIDERIPLGCARIPAGVAGSESLGDQIAPVSMTKA